MKVAILALALAAVSSAQYGGLPTCAIPCANKLIPTSCGGNANCICTFPNFIDDISCCVSKSCTSQSDISEALDTARTICAGSNVQLPSSAGCVGAAASSTGSASSSGSASSMTGTATTSAGASSTSSSAAASSTTHNPANKLTVNGMVAGAMLGAAVLL